MLHKFSSLLLAVYCFHQIKWTFFLKTLSTQTCVIYMSVYMRVLFPSSKKCLTCIILTCICQNFVTRKVSHWAWILFQNNNNKNNNDRNKNCCIQNTKLNCALCFVADILCVFTPNLLLSPIITDRTPWWHSTFISYLIFFFFSSIM